MKTYSFILFPNTQKNTFENPFSTSECTSIKDAEIWAKTLLYFNSSAEYVVFRVDGGRKEHTYKREKNTTKDLRLIVTENWVEITTKLNCEMNFTEKQEKSND